KGSLLGGGGTSRIPRCGTNTAIPLCDELVVGKTLFPSITPELLSYLFVQTFSKRLREAVGQRFDHDLGIVIVHGPVLFQQRLDANACGDGKQSNVIRLARLFRRDEIAKAKVWKVLCLLILLTQEVHHRQRLMATVSAEELDVVVRRSYGGIKSNH